MAKEITLKAFLQVETEKMSEDVHKASLLFVLVETGKMSEDALKASLLLGLVSQSVHIPVVNPRVKSKFAGLTPAAFHLQ